MELHLMVRFERDFVTEGDQQRAVAGRADGHFKVMLPSPGDCLAVRYPGTLRG